MTNKLVPIYLDYASTTPMDEKVVEKMLPFLTADGSFANPSAKHYFGLEAKKAVDEARAQVADLISASPESIIWTSGATESNNLAIKGVAEFYRNRGNHIISSQIEHPSVLEVCSYLMQRGFEITLLKPSKTGIIEKEALQEAIRPETILVSLQQVNNELGTYHDIAAMADITRAHNIIFHVDAAQSIGKLPMDVKTLPVDLLSLSAHKLYGPKGMGALYVCQEPKARLMPLLHGSGQEKNLRSGTLATHQIVGMGEAYRLVKETMHAESRRIQSLHDRVVQGIQGLKGVSINGNLDFKIPHILNICFETKTDDALQNLFMNVAASSRSACQAATLETSHVLRAMGLTNEWAHRSIRFSFGRYTTDSEIDELIHLMSD